MTRIGMPGHTHEGGTVTRYRHVVSLASHSNLTTKSSDAGALFRVPNYSSSIDAGTPPEHSENTTISSYAETLGSVTEYSNSLNLGRITLDSGSTCSSDTGITRSYNAGTSFRF